MNIAEQVKDALKEEIIAAVVKAGLADESQVPDVLLEVPKDKTHGDYSTNMAMQLARIAKKHLAKSQRTLSKRLIKGKLLLKNWISQVQGSLTFI